MLLLFFLGKSATNNVGGKCSNCPIPTCTTARGRVKGRLRHLPKKWTTLSKDSKEALSSELRKFQFYFCHFNPCSLTPCRLTLCLMTIFVTFFLHFLQVMTELLNPVCDPTRCPRTLYIMLQVNEPTFLPEIPNGTKKCCSACFQRIMRKINQLTGGACNSPAESVVKTEADLTSWADDEVDKFKNLLKSNGRNWSVISEKIANRTPEQCKKFFYNNKKKFGLDKIVLEYKKVCIDFSQLLAARDLLVLTLVFFFQANQVGDQPPSLSTDEESGSSTSSCDEDATNLSRNPSASNSPGIRNNGNHSRKNY